MWDDNILRALLWRQEERSIRAPRGQDCQTWWGCTTCPSNHPWWCPARRVQLGSKLRRWWLSWGTKQMQRRPSSFWRSSTPSARWKATWLCRLQCWRTGLPLSCIDHQGMPMDWSLLALRFTQHPDQSLTYMGCHNIHLARWPWRSSRRWLKNQTCLFRSFSSSQSWHTSCGRMTYTYWLWWRGHQRFLQAFRGLWRSRCDRWGQKY